MNKSQNEDEKYSLLMSLVRLEGLESKAKSDLETLLKNDTDSFGWTSLCNLQFQDLINELKNKEKEMIIQKEKKEKWYNKMDFFKPLFRNLITFKNDEFGIEYQELYANYIRSLFKAQLFTKIAIQSFNDFPKLSNLPEEIKAVLKSDQYKMIHKDDLLDDNNLKRNSEIDYSKFSDIMRYIYIINELTTYNLDFLDKEPKKQLSKKMVDLRICDIFNRTIYENSQINPLALWKDIPPIDGKFSQKIRSLNDDETLWNKAFDFKLLLLEEQLVLILAFLDSFIFNSIKSLLDNHKTLNLSIDDRIRLEDMQKKENNFENIITNLQKIKLLSTDFIHEPKMEYLNFARIFRNEFIHRQEFIPVIRKENNDISINENFIKNVIEIIVILSNNLYNNISLKFKSSNKH